MSANENEIVMSLLVAILFFVIMIRKFFNAAKKSVTLKHARAVHLRDIIFFNALEINF